MSFELHGYVYCCSLIRLLCTICVLCAVFFFCNSFLAWFVFHSFVCHAFMWILLHSESMLSFIMPQTSSLWHRSSSFFSHFIDMAQAFATFAIPTVCVHTVHKYILWTELILVQFYISKGNTLWCDESSARTWPFHEKYVFSLNT